jgi:hypothetical protein
VKALFLILLLAGCSYHMMPPAREVSTVTIEWRRVTPKQCGDLRTTTLFELLGCAHFDGTTCLLEMPEDAPDWLIAHEFRHCFGYSHQK